MCPVVRATILGRESEAVLDRSVRVLLADDDDRVRAALQELLEEDPTFVVVASVATGDEAVAAAARVRPAVALVDLRMPAGGEAVVRAIRRRSPATLVVVCTSVDDPHHRAAARDAGAAAYVVKGDADVLDALRALLSP
jgi:DNA-binding NarL/FixJ family response regulator